MSRYEFDGGASLPEFMQNFIDANPEMFTHTTIEENIDVRATALDFAITLYSNQKGVDLIDVMAAAERFLEFLSPGIEEGTVDD